MQAHPTTAGPVPQANFLYETQLQAAGCTPTPPAQPQLLPCKPLSVLNGPVLCTPVVGKPSRPLHSSVPTSGSMTIMLTPPRKRMPEPQLTPRRQDAGQTVCLHVLSTLQAFLQQHTPQEVSLVARSSTHSTGPARCNGGARDAALGVVRVAAVEYPSVAWNAARVDDHSASHTSLAVGLSSKTRMHNRCRIYLRVCNWTKAECKPDLAEAPCLTAAERHLYIRRLAICSVAI